MKLRKIFEDNILYKFSKNNNTRVYTWKFLWGLQKTSYRKKNQINQAHQWSKISAKEMNFLTWCLKSWMLSWLVMLSWHGVLRVGCFHGGSVGWNVTSSIPSQSTYLIIAYMEREKGDHSQLIFSLSIFLPLSLKSSVCSGEDLKKMFGILLTSQT